MSDKTLWEGYDLTQFGGVQRGPEALAVWTQLTGVQLVQSAPVWDFGWHPPEDLAQQSPRTFVQAAPQLQGTWDGKSSFSLWEIGKRLLEAGQVKFTPDDKGYLPAQRQTLGTCVSRGWSLGCNLLQFAQVAAGQRWEFQPVAHAPIYGGSREIAGILGPPGSSDGSFGSAAAKWVTTGGNTHLEETQDQYDSDTKAGQMGYRGVPADVKALAKDNLVADAALVTTFQQAADSIWNGKPVPVCSGQGFSMTRGADGFCAPQGSWAHCMLFGSIVVLPSGKRGLGCGQSWGKNTPNGPPLPGCPDYVFGVDEATCNRMLSGKDSYAIAGLTGWAPSVWNIDWRIF